MILDLLSAWRINKSRSFLIGDKSDDLMAASAAGIAGRLYRSGNLAGFTERLLTESERGGL